MLPDGRLLLLVGEVVSDFVPDSDPLDALERGIYLLLLVNVLHPWVLCFGRLFMCLLKLFIGNFLEESAHYQRIDKLIVALTPDLLTLDELVVETVVSGQVLVVNLLCLQLLHLVLRLKLAALLDLFLQGVVAFFRDFGKERVHARLPEVFSRVLECLNVLLDALLVSLSLLILVQVSSHAFFGGKVFTLSLHATPVALNNKGCMFLLFLHDVVDVASVQVLDEVVFTTHCFNSLEGLIPCLEQSPLLSLVLIEVSMRRC